MKVCVTCGEAKSEESFSWRVKDVKRHGKCKDCHRAYHRAHYENNRQRYIDKATASTNKLGKRWELYKVSREEWEQMVARYDGACWVCKTEPATAVDHDHLCCPGPKSCGACVRGALCKGCNTGLGMFKDNPEFLQNAITYLEP